MIKQIQLEFPPLRRGCHLITNKIIEAIGELPQTGLLNVFVKHTSCALTINENADPDVKRDLANLLDRVVPENNVKYLHTDEGEDDMPAHGKSSLVGVSLTIPITNGRLNLGMWQGIYLCEFRNFGSSRTIVLTIYS